MKLAAVLMTLRRNFRSTFQSVKCFNRFWINGCPFINVIYFFHLMLNWAGDQQPESCLVSSRIGLNSALHIETWFGNPVTQGNKCQLHCCLSLLQSDALFGYTEYVLIPALASHPTHFEIYALYSISAVQQGSSHFQSSCWFHCLHPCIPIISTSSPAMGHYGLHPSWGHLLLALFCSVFQFEEGSRNSSGHFELTGFCCPSSL